MYAFALTIVGAVIIGAVFEFFIIDGEMKKYMNSAVSLIIIVILITPVITIFNNGFSIENITSKDEEYFEVDQSFMLEIKKERANDLANHINNTFLSLKYKAKAVSFEMGEDDVLIKKINISTLDTVISGEDLNIVDIEDIVTTVNSVSKNSIERIVIDDKDAK